MLGEAVEVRCGSFPGTSMPTAAINLPAVLKNVFCILIKYLQSLHNPIHAGQQQIPHSHATVLSFCSMPYMMDENTGMSFHPVTD
jgi:hypothetical protein